MKIEFWNFWIAISWRQQENYGYKRSKTKYIIWFFLYECGPICFVLKLTASEIIKPAKIHRAEHQSPDNAISVHPHCSKRTKLQRGQHKIHSIITHWPDSVSAKWTKIRNLQLFQSSLVRPALKDTFTLMIAGRFCTDLSPLPKGITAVSLPGTGLRTDKQQL